MGNTKNIYSWIWQKKFWLLGSAAIIAVIPLLLHSLLMPLELNQFLIQRLRWSYGVASVAEIRDSISSVYSSGLNILRRWPSQSTPEYSDRKAMFEYVFRWIPTQAYVYPTEGFYYWKFQHGQQGETWGNLRIADLDKGKLFFTYFRPPAKDRLTPGPDAEDFGRGLLKDTLSIILTEKDGIAIERKSPDLYCVSYQGKTVQFHINPEGLEPPKNVRLHSEEEFVGRVHDESGVKFLLLYNQKTYSFYYILDPERGVTDRFEPLDSTHSVGKRSGFVFFEDREFERKLLVGVDMYQSERNSYFDGPQDQVPFRANLRQKLYEAYPNTMLGDGCDESGVLLNTTEWARVAIAPFTLYRHAAELLERDCKKIHLLDKSILWTALTKEWWNNQNYRQGVAQRLLEEGEIQPIPEELYLPDLVWMEPMGVQRGRFTSE